MSGFSLSVTSLSTSHHSHSTTFSTMSDAFTLNIHSYGQSDLGLQRDQNEDAFVVNDQLQLYAVADGLGGLPSGDLASQMAIKGLIEQAQHTTSLFDMQAAFRTINQQIQKAGQSIAAGLGIGTTLTAIKIEGSEALIGHAGDSGILLLRNGQCRKLTNDHTMAEEAKANLPPTDYSSIPEHYHHTLTRCLGQLDVLPVDLLSLALQANDRVLLFTDGVSKTHSFDELERFLQSSSDPRDTVQTIIASANSRGGPDNCTAILLHILSSQELLCAQRYSKQN